MMPIRRHGASQGTRRRTSLICLILACAVLPLRAQAQAQAQAATATATATATPTPQQMVEQLKNPRTRSLRNLSVEAAPAPDSAEAGKSPDNKGVDSSVSAATATSAARPSLSLLIQFDFNSARVRPDSQHALGNLSQALQSSELAGSKFAVEGHTDARGSADYNQKLSQQRALAVRDILASSGVAQDRLLPAGRGATALANSAEPFAAENRRVRIVNLD